MTNANTPAPSANIYIDLSPISSTYGVNKVVAPGIQAIELMVNCEKDGYGKQLKGINDSGSAATSSGVGSLKEAYVLSINPRNLMNGASDTSLEGQGLLNLSESVVVSEVTTTSQSIVVTNPGTREAVLKSNADGTGDSGASGYLNSTLLSEANGFPSGTIVRIVNDNGVFAPNIGANGVESSTTATDLRQRVDIVWDASSVDLVAATEATENSNGLRLAGYVYGYALNSVVAAIPVYLTSDYQVTDVQAYVDYNGDGTREKADIKLDVSSPNGSALPDIVYVTFENDIGYYFGTALKDANGETYQALRESSSGVLEVNGVKYEAVSTTDAEGVTTITPTTYPAYATYLVKSTATDGTAIKVGDTYYKTVTYEGVTYLVIRNGITSAFPVGAISWDDTSFGWEGGETTVNFSYSWGYATETSYAASVKVVANNVTAIELPESVNGILTLNESGNGITLNLDELLKDVAVEDYKSTIINTLKALDNLTVTLGGETSAILYAGWDLTALESAIDALAVKDGEAVKSYNFYQGLRADATLWLGGKPVEGGKAFYNNGGAFNGSGFVYNAENTVNYADEGYIAQAFTVTVTVDSNVVDNVVGGLVFNPYAEYAASMETSDFAGREVEIRFADGSNRVFTVSDSQSGGRNIRISYLCVISGDKEYVVWDGTGTEPESNVALADLMKEISFKGYTGKYGDIYLVGTIGTDIVGVQQVYLPVTVESLSPVYKEHGFVTTSTAGTEIGVDTSYAVDKLGNFMFSTDGTAYKLAHGKQNFEWNFSTSLGTTETVSVNLLWNNAKFYTDSGFVNEVALGSLQVGSYYYAILPFSVNGAATGSGEYQTIKVQLYFAARGVEIEAGSTLPVTSGDFTGNVFRFADKNNIPDMSLVEYITQEIGTSLVFGSQVGNVTVELASVNFGSFEDNKNRNLRDIASAGGYNDTVTYSFTATAENGLEYKFTGNVSIYVVSTKPVDPVVNPVLVTIDDVRLNQIVVDPLAYASFNAYVAAFTSAYAGKTFTTKNGNAIVNGTFDSLSFSDIGYAENGDNNSALPLAGGNYSGKRVDFTDANGVKYYGYVDVVVVNREVSSYEFVLNGFEATVARGEMGAIRTTTYVNNTTGAVVRIVTNAAGLPTAINVLNPFAFDWETIFAAGSGLLVTLSDTGEQLLLSVDNPFATGDLAKAFDGFSLSTGYTNESLTLSFRNGDVAVPFNITVEFTVDPVKLTMYNTDLASDALAYNGLKYNASVYGYESLGGKVVPSVYDLLKGTEEFVWYVDGMFVKSSAKDTYVAMGYKVLAGEQGEYSYNYNRGMYTLEENGKYVFVYSAAVTMDAVWDHTQLSYSFAGGIRDTYAVVSANGTTVGNISTTVTVPVNIYSSELATVDLVPTGYDFFGADNVVRYEKQIIAATYRHVRIGEDGSEIPVDPTGEDVAEGSNISYGTVTNEKQVVFGNPATAIYFVYYTQKYTANYKVEWTVQFGEDGTETGRTEGTPEPEGDMVADGNATDGMVYFRKDGGSNYVNLVTGEFHFDPLSGIDPFEQVTLTFPVVGEMTVYKWFPLSVSVTTKGGLTNTNLYVGWTLSDFVFNFEGGSFKAIVNLKETSMNGGTNVIPEQRFTPSDNNVVVKEREVSAVNTTEADYGALAALTGFAGNGTYIDPYNFDIAVFRRAVGDIGSLKFTLGGSEYVFSADSKEYNLSWDYSRFSVTYLGGAVYLTALLTGPDGSTQTYSFTFLVTRVLVNQIVATKGGTVDLGASVNFSINTDVTSANLGVATSNHNIDPFVPKSQSLPKGWTVNFTASNPDYVDGVVTGGWTSTSYASLSKDYIAVSMPKIDWTWDMVTGGKTIGYATMQIENGQRLKINVTVTARGTAAPATKPTATTKGSLYSLQTSVKVGDSVYSVVWVGTASVMGSGNTYDVTFASAGSEYVIQRKGQRKVTYNLTAYVGAVIDANGNVLIYDESGKPAKLVAYDGYGFTV